MNKGDLILMNAGDYACKYVVAALPDDTVSSFTLRRIEKAITKSDNSRFPEVICFIVMAKSATSPV